jgi:hypothetical protein
MTAKKRSRSKPRQTTLRHLWLAGLGVVSVVRRQAAGAANDAAHRMETLKRQAEQMAGQAQASVAGSLASVRQQGEVRVGRFSADVEMRLAPVLAKLGVLPQTAAKPRAPKPATATRSRNRTSRTPAAGKSPVKRALRTSRA